MARLLGFAALFAITTILLFTPRPALSQPQTPKPDEELVAKVRKAIDNGVRYLKSVQNPSGDWEGIVLEGIVLNFLAEMKGGATSLVTLALLNAGLKAEDPVIAKALTYLRSLPPQKTYVVGLQNMVFAEVHQAKDLPQIQQNVAWLEQKAIGFKNGAGRLEGWSYPPGAAADNSNTQYALLGLYAAKQAGVKVSDTTWKAVLEYYTRTQSKPSETTGFWVYVNYDPKPSFTMTVAGVSGLLIAGMGLDQSEQQLDLATGVAANCGVYKENEPVARGMNWIAANFDLKQGQSVFYNIYGLERLGRFSGQRFIGKFDWYREGCEFLVRIQNERTGAFEFGNSIDSALVLSTAFSLLFLSKGRTPVLMSKFAWGEIRDVGNGTFVERGGPRSGAVNWNRKHNDARNMVEFASRELFKGTPLSWQVYDVRRQNLDTDDKILSEVGILLQSPVLYLNGHGKIPFVGLPGELLNVQEKVLQKYVDEGGFILAEACCGDPEFTKSFRELMKRLFPNNDLRVLPESHSIWSAAFKDEGLATFAGLEGLERGCRTVVVFSPTPLAGYWEEHRFMPEKDKAAAKPGMGDFRGEMAYKLSANIIAYATGLELPKPKLTTQKLVDPASVEKGATRGMFQVVQLKQGNDSEPAPAAIRNLMSHIRDKTRLEVMLKKESLDPSDNNIFKFKFMYLHGRRPINYSDDNLDDLKSNLQTGGLLFADASCNGMAAWQQFDSSFRDMCKKMFPDNALQIIPADDPIFSAKINGGTALTSVRCRRERADGKAPEAEMRSYAPFLEGVKVDGRWVIVYSKYDIGCALEGNKSADCMGYDKESALKIGMALVLYSLKR